MFCKLRIDEIQGIQVCFFMVKYWVAKIRKKNPRVGFFRKQYE